MIEIREGAIHITVKEGGKTCKATLKPEITEEEVNLSLNIKGDVDACQTLIDRYLHGFIDIEDLVY